MSRAAVVRDVGFARLGRKNRARLVVPLSPYRAKRNALRLHAPQWWAGRLWWSAVKVRESLRVRSVGSKNGRAFASRFTLDLDSAFDVELSEWLEQVAARLTLDSVVPAFYLPPQVDRKRLSVLLMDSEGTPRAYAKIGWARDGSIRREATGLEWAQGVQSELVRVPRLIEYAESDSFAYALQTAIPIDCPSGPRKWCSMYSDAISQIQGSTRSFQRLDDMNWFSDRRGLDPRWSAIATGLKALDPWARYRLAAAHGDWVPWNIRHGRRQLWLCDWESHSTVAPVLADRIHFDLSVHILVDHRSPSRAMSLVWSALDPGIEKQEYSEADVLLAFLFLLLSGRTLDDAAWSPMGEAVAQHLLSGERGVAWAEHFSRDR